MPIETRSREGRYEVIHRRHAGGAWSRLLRAALPWLGLALLATPVLLTRPESGLSLGGLVALQILVAVAGVKLLAETYRRERAVTTLFIASGEVEVRRGRWPLGVARALGAVETDELKLTRQEGDRTPLFSVDIVPLLGPPVPVITADPDEGACRDAALVLSQGMAVPLSDTRYGTPEGAAPPVRMARCGDDRRTVLTWSYRDRFRPGASLLALGSVTAISALLPVLADRVGLLLVPIVVVDLLLALALAVHVLVTLTERKVTLRPDAIRVERFLSAIPLLQRLILYREIKAILVFRRGSLASLKVRLEGGGRGVALPFEEARVAGWLKLTIDREAHQAGERAALARGAPGARS
ncbi:MAG: hypothetical protein ACYTDY_09175 [Planctomycetota bacterium]|jgi:hypothetical protein